MQSFRQLKCIRGVVDLLAIGAEERGPKKPEVRVFRIGVLHHQRALAVSRVDLKKSFNLTFFLAKKDYC